MSSSAEPVMSEQAPHLSLYARELLNHSAEERIRQIRKDHWVGYKRASDVLRGLETLKDYPPQERMPYLLIVGDTNYGKSAIIDRFAALYPSHPNPNSDFLHAPVVKIDSPDKADERRLFNRILSEIQVPPSRNEKPHELEARFYTSLRNARTRLLIVDNLHDIIGSSTQAQRDLMKTIRKISTQLKMSVAATGLKEVIHTIKSEPQLRNRFTFVYHLEKFDIYDENDSEDLVEYATILTSLERFYPLKKPSNLKEPDMVAKIYQMSEGILGKTVKLLKGAATLAIELGTEQITEKLLDETDYQSPLEE